MDISTNYSGHTTDIELLKTISYPGGGSQQVHLSLTYNNTPRAVAGIEKLAQRYALLFLTELGSVQFDSTIGSIFVPYTIGGNIQTYGAFISTFAIANAEVTNIIRGNIDGLTDDEILESAELVDFNLDKTNATITLQIKLISRAGSTLVFTLPTTTVTV